MLALFLVTSYKILPNLVCPSIASCLDASLLAPLFTVLKLSDKLKVLLLVILLFWVKKHTLWTKAPISLLWIIDPISLLDQLSNLPYPLWTKAPT